MKILFNPESLKRASEVVFSIKPNVAGHPKITFNGNNLN